MCLKLVKDYFKNIMEIFLGVQSVSQTGLEVWIYFTTTGNANNKFLPRSSRWGVTVSVFMLRTYVSFGGGAGGGFPKLPSTIVGHRTGAAPHLIHDLYLPTEKK